MIDFKPMIKFNINNEQKGVTIRDFLSSFYLSKTNIYKLEMNKSLYINQKPALLQDILNANDILYMDTKMIEAEIVEPMDKEVELVYEDDDLAIFNKPAFMLVHTDQITIDTLNNRVNAFYQKQGYMHPVLPVHRIDFETSGMVCFAKHKLSHSYMSYLFENHQIKKKYRCLVEGKMPDQSGIINQPIGKNRHTNQQITSKTGKDALTSYQVIDENDNQTKLEVTIKGGRKHQIRVHLQSMMKPIIGDQIYRGKDASRLMLHFYLMSFIHPRTKKEVTYQVKESF